MCHYFALRHACIWLLGCHRIRELHIKYQAMRRESKCRGAQLTRTKALFVAKGCFFFPPSLPLTAAEKRKLNILVMLIFSAPHAHFLSNEDLPTFTNSNSFLLLPLGAVKVQPGSVLLSKKVWKQRLSFKVTPTKCLKFSFLGSYKQNLAESSLLWSSFSTDKQIFKLKVAPVSHK